jgi:hypothetical protein
MYNRYIPKPDGSYQKHAMTPLPPTHSREPEKKDHDKAPIGDFFKNLIPRELDTGDLLMILLLLLMAGDSGEDQNNAILTLALYLFM